jgi:hypothetical protein
MRIEPRAFVLKNEPLRLAHQLEKRWLEKGRGNPELARQQDYEGSVLPVLRSITGVAERAVRLEPHGMWHVDAGFDFGGILEAAISAGSDPGASFRAWKARVQADLMCNAHIVKGVILVRGLGRMQSVIATLNAGDLPSAMPLVRLLYEESLEAFLFARRMILMVRQYEEIFTTTEDPFRYEIDPETERTDAGAEAPDPSDLAPLEARMRNFLMGRRVPVEMEGEAFNINRFNILTAIRTVSRPDHQAWMLQMYGGLSELSHPSGPTNELFTPYSIAERRRTYRFSTRGADSRKWVSPASHEEPLQWALTVLALGGQTVISLEQELEEAIAGFEQGLLNAMAGVPAEAHVAVDRALRSAGFTPCDSAAHVVAGTEWPPLPTA